MTSAGRILIMPKGNYDESVTYEMLDLVYYNGKSWLAKKTTIGIEPSEANSEHWQDMFGLDLTPYAKKEDLDDFLPLTGGTLSGDTSIRKALPKIDLKATETRSAMFYKSASENVDGGTIITDNSDGVVTTLTIKNGTITLYKKVDGVDVGSVAVAEVKD